MEETPKPIAYLILGAAGSGRREVLADLIEEGMGEGERAVVFLAESEAPAEADARLGDIVRWKWHPGTAAIEGAEAGRIEGSLEEEGEGREGQAGGGEGRTEGGGGREDEAGSAGARRVFFVTDGRQNPVDQIEAFKPWLESQGCELGRILCVVNCRLAEKAAPLLAWYEACIHFADVVLLNRREGVANKWMRDFQSRFADRFFPCLFEFVREGRVRNPALLLHPEARRLSHVFDEDQEWIVTDVDGEELDPDDEIEEGEMEVQASLEVDPYLERRNGGRRVKELPEVAKFL